MAKTYQPNYAVIPGETLGEALSDRGYSYVSFASLSGMSSEAVKGIIDGTVKIDEPIAECFEKHLGLPKSFWMNRQKNYDETVARLRDGGEV